VASVQQAHAEHSQTGHSIAHRRLAADADTAARYRELAFDRLRLSGVANSSSWTEPELSIQAQSSQSRVRRCGDQAKPTSRRWRAVD
jgi:hypothetical protein